MQRDHPELLRAVMGVLRPDGVVYFSNNLRGFQLDPQLASDYVCEDITDQTLGPDFQRSRRIHRCWRLQLGS